MFDANTRYLSKGTKFFADVYACEKGTGLYNKGIRIGDVIYCEMLDESEKNPSVKFHIGEENFVISDEEEFYDYWFVYAGNIRDEVLHDFISEGSKKKAVKLIEELKL